MWVEVGNRGERSDRNVSVGEGAWVTTTFGRISGTFYSGDELPGRDISQIPHPMVSETMKRLGRGDADDSARVWFVHLNHSNPLLGPGRKLRRSLEQRGFGVADEGLRIPL